MIPKKIHLCWFGGRNFPVEIKMCLESWAKVLPDYEIRLWNARDARAIGCQYIDEALDAGKWAFAADAVRFYAVWKEGGIYMDSDIMLTKRFDRYIPERGFATVHEHIGDNLQIQAAFFMGEKDNAFCREMFAYYDSRPFKKRDGSFDQTISPLVMKDCARRMGWKENDSLQILDNNTVVYPGYLVTPRNSGVEVHTEAFAHHRIYGSWRKRKLGRRLELGAKHLLATCRYYLTHIGKKSMLPPIS
ncbi:MAG: glycosyltransferase [Muribaculaceae bacterium]|nr:glycosyltransferase [Muribaculaceae bacterium]